MQEKCQARLELFKMFYCTTNFHDPACNLALEERLLRALPKEHPGYFLLWQNNPSVIIGRYQCALEELDAHFASQANLPLFRRISGGGAVYHDLGNLNFSFIFHAPGRAQMRPYLELIQKALGTIGIRAEISGRNDLEVRGRKISGCAMARLGAKQLLHGTLLFNSNLDILAKVLRPGKDKIISKGIQSIRARVANLAELIPGLELCQLKAALGSGLPTGTLPVADLEAAESLAALKYRQWDWNYGASPPFDIERRKRFSGGTIILRLAVRNGQIGSCRILGDFFSFGEIARLETLLEGRQFSRQSLESALRGIDLNYYFYGCPAEEVLEFLLSACGQSA